MKTRAINILVLCLAGISIFLQPQGCYTLIKNPGRSYSSDRNASFNSQTSDSCIVEGMVRYYDFWGTREISRPTGYVLDNIFWLKNAPPLNIRYISIDSKNGRDYLNKYVRIKGRFTTPFSAFYYSLETTSVSIKISEIEIMEQ